MFLTIARKAEVEAAAQEGRSTETIHLANGAVLKVPLGEEYATVEGGTQQYQVKWAQDESGNLQVQLIHCTVEDTSFGSKLAVQLGKAINLLLHRLPILW